MKSSLEEHVSILKKYKDPIPIKILFISEFSPASPTSLLLHLALEILKLMYFLNICYLIKIIGNLFSFRNHSVGKGQKSKSTIKNRFVR